MTRPGAWIKTLALVSTLAIVVGACSSSSATQAPSVAASAAASAAAASTAPAASPSAAAAASPSARSITASVMAGQPTFEYYQSLAPQFEQQTGIHVNFVSFPWAELQQNNINQIVSGTCSYDVMAGGWYLAPIFEQIQPIDDLAAKSNFGPALTPAAWQQGFYLGKHLGTPFAGGAYGLMYNTKLWADAGLSWPTTWDEFLSDLGILKTKYASQGIYPFVFAGGAQEQLENLFNQTYDGYFVDKSGKYALDPAKAVAAIQYALKELSYAPPNTTSLSIDEANAVWFSGKAVVMYGWTSFANSGANDPSKSKIVNQWAVGVNPPTGMTTMSVWNWFIPKCSQNIDAVWQWLMFLASPEHDKTLFTKYGQDPVLQANWNDLLQAPEYANYLVGEKANFARSKMVVLSSDPETFLDAQLGEVLAGKTTPEAAVAAINSHWAGVPVLPSLLTSAQAQGLVAP